MRRTVSRTLRAIPTLLRVGVAETVAYRAEFLVWVLTTTMPLVMLGLWTSVASEAPFHGYSSTGFVAYYLSTLIVRNLTGAWVAWQISDEIRTGVMSMRLLRPIHPFAALACNHVAALPFRSLVALPVAIILLVSTGGGTLPHAPAQLALILPSIALGWLITFSVLFAIGALGFFITKTMAIADTYFALFVPLSGYLMPLELMKPHWIVTLASWTPFPSMLSTPVRLISQHLTSGAALHLVAVQVAWAAACVAIALVTWRAGVRHYEAVGG